MFWHMLKKGGKLGFLHNSHCVTCIFEVFNDVDRKLLMYS